MNECDDRIPRNDVDLLAAQAVGDVGDAARLRPEARADRVDFGTMRAHGDLRTAAGFACDRHDLDDAVRDLRNVHLEQALNEPLGGARENDLRALRRLANVEYVRAHEIVDAERLARNLLVDRHDGFVAAFEHNEHVALLVALHRSGHQVVELARVLIEDGVALGLADALHDDLLGRLRGDASEIFRRDFLIEEVARLIRLAGLSHRDLELGIFDRFGDDAAMEHLVRAGRAVHGDDRVGFAAEVALVRGQERRFERFEQHLERNVPLFCDEVEDVDKFFVGSCVAIGFLPFAFVALEIRAGIVFEVCRFYGRDRERQFAVLGLEDHGFAAQPAQRAAMRFAAVDEQRRYDARPFAGESLVVRRA